MAFQIVLPESRFRRTTTATFQRRLVTCFTQSVALVTTDARVIEQRRYAYTLSRIVKKPRSSKTCEVTHFPTMVRRYWCSRDLARIFTTQRHRASAVVRPYRLPDCMSIAFRRKNGTRSSMRFGVDIVIGSMSQTCTALIG